MRNPKLIHTELTDCIPQAGKCPYNCAECYFNKSFYTETPMIPEEEDKIVRMNTGNDSHNQKDLVIKTAKKYRRVFFNTSTPDMDFPGPVVVTINPDEEVAFLRPGTYPKNLMFVRIRVSDTNLKLVDEAVKLWTEKQVPVVLTFMRYADRISPNYQHEKHILNSYYCPTPTFIKKVMARYARNRLVSMCGSVDSSYCKDCLNCVTHYNATVKRMRNE